MNAGFAMVMVPVENSERNCAFPSAKKARYFASSGMGPKFILCRMFLKESLRMKTLAFMGFTPW